MWTYWRQYNNYRTLFEARSSNDKRSFRNNSDRRKDRRLSSSKFAFPNALKACWTPRSLAR